MAILITGGAGYVGGATLELLTSRGEQVVVIDDLFRGHRRTVPQGVHFHQGKVGDRALVAKILRDHDIDACMHFAALAYVGESMTDPERYYSNNAGEGLAFLNALLDGGVRRFVFSSTCATYGVPEVIPIPEKHPQSPANPYGWSKFFMERVLESYDRAYGMTFVTLRYFNAAGATERHGEDHEPEPHLIPNVLAAANGRQPYVSVFGKDYPTPDGTAVRDYVHIADLADAHVRALEWLRAGNGSEFFNLGNGFGYSVLEVIRTAREITGRDIPVRFERRRPGDPPRLVADAAKARHLLGWHPEYPHLASILRTAWNWHEARWRAENLPDTQWVERTGTSDNADRT